MYFITIVRKCTPIMKESCLIPTNNDVNGQEYHDCCCLTVQSNLEETYFLLKTLQVEIPIIHLPLAVVEFKT